MDTIFRLFCNVSEFSVRTDSVSGEVWESDYLEIVIVQKIMMQPIHHQQPQMPSCRWEMECPGKVKRISHRTHQICCRCKALPCGRTGVFLWNRHWNISHAGATESSCAGSCLSTPSTPDSHGIGTWYCVATCCSSVHLLCHCQVV